MTNKTTIPIGWKAMQLENVTTKISDGLHSTPQYVSNSKFYFINGNNLINDKITITNITKCVTEEEYNSHKKNLNSSTILLSINGTIGNVAYYRGETVVLGKSAAYLNCSDDVNKRYIFYFLKTSKTQNHFISELTGSTIKNLSLKSIKNADIYLPPIPEQEKIVEVLETWDSYLEKLSRAIKLKKKVKKGLMQKLLRGKAKLPGFSATWETKEIGELLDYEQPTNYIVQSTEYSDEYETPVLTAGKTFVLGRTNETVGIYNKVPIIIFDDFTTVNKFVTFPFKVKSSAMKFLKAKDSNVNLKFVYEIMQIIKFPVGEHKRNYLSEYQYLTIDIPNLEEQTAIAQILTTADQEIEALEKKKGIIEQQKKFLLNNMITGKIRLPEFECMKKDPL